MSHAIAVSHGAFGRAALYNLDKPIITHAHREGHLIFHLSGASASVTVGAQTVPNDPQHATAISPWEPHSFNHVIGHASLCLVLYIKPMWFLENSQSAEYALKFGTCKIRITPSVAGLVRRLTGNLLENEQPAQFDHLLFALTRDCFEQSWQSGQCRLDTVCARFNDFRVRRSQRLMQERITEDLDMETLARSVGLSRPHFFKLFKQQFGVTPNVYMNTLRSEQAIDDLLTTAKSVTDIAFDLGFSSQASFTRFFSSNVGIAPSEYRRVAHVSGRNSGAGFPMMGQPTRLSGMPI